ncbi:TPA: hypothetical protein ACV7UK_001702 [Escherichia coli]
MTISRGRNISCSALTLNNERLYAEKTILALCISAPFLVAGCDDATKENVSKKAADIKEAAQTQLSDVKDAAEEVKMQAAGKVVEVSEAAQSGLSEVKDTAPEKGAEISVTEE